MNQPEIKAASVDEKASNYANTVSLDPYTYKGDVETAFTCGYMEAESDVIRRLKKDDTFSFSKIAEIMGVSVTRVRSAFIEEARANESE